MEHLPMIVIFSRYNPSRKMSTANPNYSEWVITYFYENPRHYSPKEGVPENLFCCCYLIHDTSPEVFHPHCVNWGIF